MSARLATVYQYLLQDDFTSASPGPLSPTIWGYSTGAAEYIPSTLGPSYPGTELQPYLPSVSNGSLQLPLQTYNPTSQPPGTSFQGSGIFSIQSFSDNTPFEGIAFTATAGLTTSVPGMVGGIFAYSANSPASHNEIDLESLTDTAAAQNNQEQTNIYMNTPTNTPGDPQFVPDPSLTTYQTYTIEWFPNDVLWFIDGQLVRESTDHVPQSALQFYLDFWAYDASRGGILQPTSQLSLNMTYNFDVQSVSVAAIENNTTPDDFFYDGHADILWQNTNGQVAIWDMNGISIVDGGMPTLNPGSAWQIEGSGNFFGNGQTDILWQNTDGQVAIWDMSGATIANGGVVALNPGSAWQIRGTGDFFGDFNTDMLWQNTNGSVAIWDMNGATIVNGGVVALNPGASWQIRGTGDFFGDGHTDILWQNTSGSVAIWDMDGTTIINGGLVAANPGHHGRSRAPANFFGDGNTDILWQNTNGAVAIWDMSGTAIVNEGTVALNPGPTWQIEGVGGYFGYGQTDHPVPARQRRAGTLEDVWPIDRIRQCDRIEPGPELASERRHGRDALHRWHLWHRNAHGNCRAPRRLRADEFRSWRTYNYWFNPAQDVVELSAALFPNFPRCSRHHFRWQWVIDRSEPLQFAADPRGCAGILASQRLCADLRGVAQRISARHQTLGRVNNRDAV